jgi:hypothetical protein
MSHDQFLDCLHRLLLYIGFAIVGVLMLVGAYRRWRWLIDPPLSWSPYYSQAVLKEMMGPTAVLYFTYFLGLALFAAGCFTTYQKVVWCRLISHQPPHWVRPSS